MYIFYLKYKKTCQLNFKDINNQKENMFCFKKVDNNNYEKELGQNLWNIRRNINYSLKTKK